MKANELMIDDWVSHEGEQYQIRQLGIYGENRDGEDYPAVCVGKPKGIGLIVERNEIEPIPLTAEILEKNGFKYSMPHNDWTNVDCNFYLYEWGNGYRIQSTDIKLDYVHQLQHLFRLCNIDKEIEP